MAQIGGGGRAILAIFSVLAGTAPTPASADEPDRPLPAAADDSVLVPAGWFTMGSDDHEADEAPAHRVYLHAYRIDRTEVTTEAYARCVAAGACTEPGFTLLGRCNWGDPSRGQHPINCVDWRQADAYCRWVGKRLPTEAEWEKAARGVDARSFPWGEERPSCTRAVIDPAGGRGANPFHNGCERGTTWPVGSKPLGASPYGAEDMAGNLWEWVADRYDDDYYRRAPDHDPLGPGKAHHPDRVLRGGSYSYVPRDQRSSKRRSEGPQRGFAIYGFRCADDP